MVGPPCHPWPFLRDGRYDSVITRLEHSMSDVSSHLRRLMVAFLSIYLFIYPWSILLIALDRVPEWGTWMSSALLILMGSMMGLWLTFHHGWRGALAAALILVISGIIEHIGVETGFPFGTYTYTEVLAPKVAGVVPLAIPFAWLMVVPAAMGITERVLGARPQSTRLNGWAGWRLIGVTASFALLLDVTIEPVAFHIKHFWLWENGGGYYGVPVSNFVAWWVISALFATILLVLRRPRPATTPLLPPVVLLPWLPAMLYVTNLVMFVAANLSRSQVAAAAIGGLILAYLAFDRLIPGAVRWVLGLERSDEQQSEA